MLSVEVKKVLRGLEGGLASLSNKAAMNVLATAASETRNKEIISLVDTVQESASIHEVALAQAASAARIGVLDQLIKICGGADK
jgi:hypothetical protein